MGINTLKEAVEATTEELEKIPKREIIGHLKCLANNYRRFLERHHPEMLDKNGQQLAMWPTGADELDSIFEEWWNLYPRRISKKASKSAFNSVFRKRLIDWNGLRRKTVEFAKAHDRAKTRLNLIVHPATYLNRELFNEEVCDLVLTADERQMKIFDEIVEIYPLKRKLNVAREEFSAMCQDERYEPEKLLQKVLLFSRSAKGNSQYCPSLAAFIKGQWYEDDPSSWDDAVAEKRTVSI